MVSPAMSNNKMSRQSNYDKDAEFDEYLDTIDRRDSKHKSPEGSLKQSSKSSRKRPSSNKKTEHPSRHEWDAPPRHMPAAVRFARELLGPQAFAT